MAVKEPQDIARAAVTSGDKKVHTSWDKVLVGAFLAGAYIAFGGLVAVTVSSGLDPEVWGTLPTLFMGAAFTLGLVLVLIAGSHLATGNMLLGPLGAAGPHRGGHGGQEPDPGAAREPAGRPVRGLFPRCPDGSHRRHWLISWARSYSSRRPTGISTCANSPRRSADDGPDCEPPLRSFMSSWQRHASLGVLAHDRFEERRNREPWAPSDDVAPTELALVPTTGSHGDVSIHHIRGPGLMRCPVPRLLFSASAAQTGEVRAKDHEAPAGTRRCRALRARLAPRRPDGRPGVAGA